MSVTISDKYHDYYYKIIVRKDISFQYEININQMLLKQNNSNFYGKQKKDTNFKIEVGVCEMEDV